MRIFVDMSSLMWTCLLAGKDPEASEVEHEGRKVSVPSLAWGYENAINSLVAVLKECNCVPRDLVLVFEGKDSKRRRCMIEPTYKATRDSRPPEAYLVFNALKEKLGQVLRNLGATAVTQDGVEGDDVLAYLAAHAEEDAVVMSNDNDLIWMNGTNEYGGTTTVRINGVSGVNKYGDFDFKLVTLYKALVGDSSDNIKGVKGFGPKAWMAVNIRYGDDGCAELERLVVTGNRDEVAVIAKENGCKFLDKVVDQWDAAVQSYRLAQLHPEWVNTIRMPLVWTPGVLRSGCDDERLRRWAPQSRLVTADKFDVALAFLKSKVQETEFFTIDFETTTEMESDDWLESRGKKGVDVLGSRIVSMGLTFGANLQYGYYITVEHADTDNCTLEQLAQMLEAIPQDKFLVAHNAAGFELPVAYNAFGKRWANNGWRGFLPNIVDTRIAASFWDENQPSHGLKQLSSLLFDYQQTSYAETTAKTGPAGSLAGGVVTRSFTEGEVEMETRQYKMHQLTAVETTAYGLDDVFMTGGLWNFFKLFMQLDHTYSAFCALEQKPMYLSALAYVQGLDVDIPRLKKLEAQDAVLSKECWAKLETYLIGKGWDGTITPVFEELNAANIKQAVQIILGIEMKTMVRTPSKLAILVSALDHPDAESLGLYIAEGKVQLVNAWMARCFTGAPNFNVGSPKQLGQLMYEVIKAPVRLRNKATDAMRAAGIREGNARTDDAAIDMAIKFGDVKGEDAEVLQSLLVMKSCNTRNSLYWSSYPNMLHWQTGKIHPEIRQSSTNTRRWTGSTPNLQQLSGDSEGVRSTIKVDAGHVFVSLDFAGQEVRQVASYSEDENLMSCFVGDRKRDTHSIVGAKSAGVSYEEFMAMRKSDDKVVAAKAAAIRQRCKQVLFAVLYSAAAPKIAETLGIPEPEAQSYIDAIFNEFPKVKVWKEASEAMASTLGYVTLAGGTRRHLARLIASDDKYEASKALRQAGNARIQGAGANQVKVVMTKVWDSDLLDTTTLQWKFVVHDECCFSAHASDAAVVTQRVHAMMTADFLGNIPSESSVGIGKNYGQLVELERGFADLGVDFDLPLVQKTIDGLMA